LRCVSGTAIALMMEAVSTSETSVNFYQTKQRNIPEFRHLHTRHCKNLKYHIPICSQQMFTWKTERNAKMRKSKMPFPVSLCKIKGVTSLSSYVSMANLARVIFFSFYYVKCNNIGKSSLGYVLIFHNHQFLASIWKKCFTKAIWPKWSSVFGP
jgi:hypothetical protein